MVETPPFVRWAVRHRCPFRLDTKAELPEHAERLLRSARELFFAARDGRVVNGVAVQPDWKSLNSSREVLGFAVAEATAVYGGEERLAGACGHCIANAPGEFAGCVGVVTKFTQSETWPADDPWYPRWQQQTLMGDPLIQLADRLAHVNVKTSTELPGTSGTTEPAMFLFSDERLPLAEQINRLINACRHAAKQELQIRIQAFPNARIEGRHWYIPAHCSVCGWSTDGEERDCEFCGLQLRSQSKRLLRGTRPYRPLKDFLSGSEIESIESNQSNVANGG